MFLKGFMKIFFRLCFIYVCGTIQNHANKTYLKMFLKHSPKHFQMFLKRFCVSWEVFSEVWRDYFEMVPIVQHESSISHYYHD